MTNNIEVILMRSVYKIDRRGGGAKSRTLGIYPSAPFLPVNFLHGFDDNSSIFNIKLFVCFTFIKYYYLKCKLKKNVMPLKSQRNFRLNFISFDLIKLTCSVTFP